MDFDFSEEQEELRAHTRKLLARCSSPTHLRSLIDNNERCDRALWEELASLGVLGAAVPERWGGVGLSEMELCVIAEELGRVTAAVPFIPSICIVAETIRLVGSDAQKEKWLSQLASGQLIGSYAFSEGPGEFNASALGTRYESGGLTGRKIGVPYGDSADLILVAAYAESTLGLYAIKMSSQGITISRPETFDPLYPFVTLELDGVPAELVSGSSSNFLNHLISRAATYTAFSQVGGAEACLEMARDYALQRQIFGRELASFQAIKHRAADILSLVELARSNAYFAAWAMENQSSDFVEAAAASRLLASDAYETAARENLQIHGGFGYTWEADCHFHLRRSRVHALEFGAAETWANQLLGDLL